MQTRNNVHTIRLFDLLAMDGGEQFFESIANSFMSKNADVEQFFRKKLFRQQSSILRQLTL